MKKKWLFACMISSMLVLFSIVSAKAAHALYTPEIKQADSWLYQLQDADIDDISATDFDVVVIDYAKDGTDDTAYSREDIQQLQESGKIVLAYLSLGEAEDYRFYWDDEWNDSSPNWLGPENPNWEGNYKVKYWQSGWWDSALQPYLVRINDAGFDGVYLDIIDGYEYWGKRGYSKKQSARRMVSLIQKVRKSMNTSNPIVCPQNGEAIIEDAPKKYRKKYWRSIDCIGVEDLFFHATKADRTYRKQLFKKFHKNEKVILNVEYVKKSKQQKYLQKVNTQAFPIIPYRATPNRELDGIVQQ